MFEQFPQEASVSSIVVQGQIWRVAFQGSYWNARATVAGCVFKANDRVSVVGRKNIDLLIQHVSS